MTPERPIDIATIRKTAGRAAAWAARGFGAVLVGAALLLTSWYTVSPEEVGVVIRFGRYIRAVEPGLHFKLPLGIESVRKVPVQRQLKQEFGFRTEAAGVRTRYSTGSFEEESLMLTGDLNAAVVEWIVQYRVHDPYKYLFRVRDPVKTLRDISEATMREVVGDRTVNEVLTVGRQEVASTVEDSIQSLCDEYDTGIRVEQVVLQDVNPPGAVKPSFNEVNQAQQEREKLINEALAEYNQVIPKARGEAQQIIAQAEGYAVDRVNRAQGDSAKFAAIYAEFRKAPEVTRRRIYLETMQEILPRAGKRVVIDESLRGVIPLLDLDGGKGGGR